jgi:hypothetical protein
MFPVAGDGEITGGKCKVGWPYVARPVQVGGLGILDLERFSRALRLSWLWLAWSETQRPRVGMKLPLDETDVALFTVATRVTVHDGWKASFWLSSWIEGRSPHHSSRHCSNIADERTGLYVKR